MTKVFFAAILALLVLGNRANCAEVPKVKLMDPTWAFTNNDPAADARVLAICKKTYPDDVAVQQGCVDYVRRYMGIDANAKMRR
jgi:hypothetical protein